MAADPAELESLLNKDVDALYVLLAQQHPAHVETMFSADEAREEGRRAFERLSGPLHRKLCVEWRFCDKRNNDQLSDRVSLAAGVADVIVTVLGGIPAGTVAAILVKQGLSKFCACKE